MSFPFSFIKAYEVYSMIIVMKVDAPKGAISEIKSQIKMFGLSIEEVKGSGAICLHVLGDVAKVNTQLIEQDVFVDKVMRISEPYKKANRKAHPLDTIINVMGSIVGEGYFAVMAGPCSVENESQIVETAKAVKASGATFLRGGAFKPRTSPYAFQGLQGEGLELLKIARAETGLPIVTEITSETLVERFEADVDVIQVGARNTQNFELLKELGQSSKPILIKRGMSSTIEDLLMSAEYIMANGNDNVILCERGIKTYETATRNTLDLSAVPYLKRHTHLPVLVDPSHSTGLSWLVPPMAKAAIAAGADGLLIEVHNNPLKAICDGPQSLTPAAFDSLMQVLRKYAEIEGKEMQSL